MIIILVMNFWAINEKTFVITILVMNFMEKLRDRYIGNECSQINYLKTKAGLLSE